MSEKAAGGQFAALFQGVCSGHGKGSPMSPIWATISPCAWKQVRNRENSMISGYFICGYNVNLVEQFKISQTLCPSIG